MKKVRIDFQERDLEFMRELYELRILSAKQIKRIYYDDSWYGYNRIRELQNMGYLDSSPLTVGIRKETQFYYLTNKGIEKLKIDNPRMANKNRITEGYLASRQLTINEIYMTLKQLDKINGKKNTWEWKDSRSVKEEYKYNRRDLIAGELKNTATGEKYGVYVPTRAEKFESLSESMAKEIEKHDILRNNIILCPDTGNEKLIMRHFETNMPAVGLSLRVLPYPAGINIIYNALTDKNQYIQDLYINVFGIKPSQIVKSTYLHSTYETEDYYLAELITNDIVLRKYIEKYSTDRKDMKAIKLICWSFHEEALKKRYRHGLDKITLTPFNWSTSQMVQGVPEEETYRSKRMVKRPKHEPLTVSLSPTVCRYLKDKMTPKERGTLICNLIESTDMYKKYIKEDNNNDGE